MFGVFADSDGRYFYNLNETIYINAKGALAEHTVSYDSQWPLISYKIYGTTRLAWLLMKVNDVDLAGSIAPVKAGTVVKYIPENMAKTVVANINGF